jgi:hypothetical protein
MDHLIDRPDYTADVNYRRLYGEESNPLADWLSRWRRTVTAAASALPESDDTDALAVALTEVEDRMADLALKLDREGWPV